MHVERAIEKTPDCRLVIIDPNTAYLGRVDSHNNAEIRGMLAPIAKLAAQLRVAVVAVTHLRKGSGPAIYRSMGSLAFAAAARGVWAVAKDQENPRRRLFLPVKNNIATDVTGLSFDIRPHGSGGALVVAWDRKPVEITADDALDPDSDESGSLAEAMEWLESELSGASRPAKDTKAKAKKDGIAERTLMRAKKRLLVKAEHVGFGEGSRWMWTLPDTGNPKDAKPSRPDNLASFEEDGTLCEKIEENEGFAGSKECQTPKDANQESMAPYGPAKDWGEL